MTYCCAAAREECIWLRGAAAERRATSVWFREVNVAAGNDVAVRAQVRQSVSTRIIRWGLCR